MKSGLFLGIVFAVLLHAGMILFGGMLFSAHGIDYSTTQEVELITEEEVAEDKPEPDQEQKEPEELEAATEEAPDAAEIIDKINVVPADNAPALEAASLSAIEAALSGQSGDGGDFGGAMDFASGGRIGGTGKAGGGDDLDKAFSMSEIDQKPRAVFQAAPNFPSAMRNTEGIVTVIFVVDQSGRVTNLRVEQSSHQGFEKAAIDAVKQWKFDPAIKAGERVSCKMRVPIRFQPR